MNISVLTLVRGRHRHLTHLIHGLNAQRQAPDELVIAWMQAWQQPGLPATSFPVRHIMVEGRALPLARARNRAAQAAAYEGLVFLDVDCIPGPELVASYRRALAQSAGLYMGEVLYLPAGAVEATRDGRLNIERLDRLGERHPARPLPPVDGVRPEPDHSQLWGLSFALRRSDHERAGGMDERYEGYGGEETDYACRLAAAGIPAHWVAHARAWHQHHPLHSPPLQHFDAIIANARRFHARWQRWCMDYWLKMFCDAGFIDWHGEAADIRVLRRPQAIDIRHARLAEQARYA